jgi:hypothetical protein
MNRLLVSLIWLVTAWPAGADFVIEQKVEGLGDSSLMTIKIAGDKLRLDLSRNITVIRDLAAGGSITLLHAKRQFQRIPPSAAEKLRRELDRHAAAGTSPVSFKLQPTGKKQKISGFDAEEYTAHVGGMPVRYWIATAFPNAAAVLAPLLKLQEAGLDQAMRGRIPAASDFPGLPVRTEAELNGQKVVTTVLSVKEQPVSPEEFEPPAGYTEIDPPVFGSPRAAE